MTTDVIETNNKPLTMADLMTAVKGILAESSAKFAQDMKLSQKSWDKQNKELKQQLEGLGKTHEAFAQDMKLMQAEWDKQNKELKQQLGGLGNTHEAFSQDMKLMQAEWDKQNKELKRQIGGMGNNNGAFAQEFFFNAIFYGERKLFGQEFDDAMTEVRKYFKKGGSKSEFDIVLFNGKSICIVEVKYKADTDDARNLPEKEKSFRAGFPEHADKKLYLALASMSFDKHVENECKKQGLAMIKQVGDTIEIYDENMKVF